MEQYPARAMANPVMPLPGLTDDYQPPNVSAGQNYRTGSPVTARPMIMRWISEVPSKIVKIFAQERNHRYTSQLG